MRLIDADMIKQKYRDKFIKSLVDEDRGIDLSEYAEEPSKSFYRFIDEIPTVDVLDKIRAKIENFEINGHIRDVECFNAGIRHALTVIDKYREEQT